MESFNCINPYLPTLALMQNKKREIIGGAWDWVSKSLTLQPPSRAVSYLPVDGSHIECRY